MSISNFIPTIWSARLLDNLNKAHVYANLVNRDYQGEITGKGNKVKINTIGSITIGDYEANTDMDDPEALDGTQQELEITEAKFFNFQIDDVDNAQTTPKLMDSAMMQAGYGLSDVADQFLAGLYTGVHSDNTIGTSATPLIPDADSAYEYLIDLKTKLDEANVPSAARWVVVPSFFEGLLLKDKRFVESGSANAETRLANALIGRAAGFNVYMSNNVPNTTGTAYKVIAGFPGAMSYAEQIVKVESYRMEKRFSDAVKGLHVYGGKLTRPKGIAVLTINRS